MSEGRSQLTLPTHRPSGQMTQGLGEGTHNEINDKHERGGGMRAQNEWCVQAFPTRTVSNALTLNGFKETTIINTSNQLFIERVDCARLDLSV